MYGYFSGQAHIRNGNIMTGNLIKRPQDMVELVSKNTSSIVTPSVRFKPPDQIYHGIDVIPMG